MANLDQMTGNPQAIDQMTHYPEAEHPDQAIAQAITSIFGAPLSAAANIPKRIIQSSESMRQGGDYDPAPAVEGAMMASPLGAEMSGARMVGTGAKVLGEAARAAPKTTAAALGGAGALAASGTAAPGADKPNPKLGEINQLEQEIKALSDKLTGLSTVKMQSTKAREIASSGITAQLDAKQKRLMDLQKQVEDDAALDKAIEDARVHSQLAFNEKYAPWSHLDIPVDLVAGGLGGAAVSKYFGGKQKQLGAAWNKAIEEARKFLNKRGVNKNDPKVAGFISELEGHYKRGIPYGPLGTMAGGAAGGLAEGAAMPLVENMVDAKTLPADSPAGKQARENFLDPKWYAGEVAPYAAMGMLPGALGGKLGMQMRRPVVAPKSETEGVLAELRAIQQRPAPAPRAKKAAATPAATTPRGSAKSSLLPPGISKESVEERRRRLLASAGSK